MPFECCIAIFRRDKICFDVTMEMSSEPNKEMSGTSKPNRYSY